MRLATTDDKTIAAVADRVYAAMKSMGAYGRARARTQGEVARLAGTNTRALQHATLVLIERGVPIVTACDDPPGMFLAETLSELAAYSDQLHARLVGNAVRMKGVRRIMREWTEYESVEPNGQRRLFA